MPPGDISARQVGYSLRLGFGPSRELRNYDTFAASFLVRAIYHGDYKLVLEVAPRAERCVTDVPLRKIWGCHRDASSAASAVGRPVSDVLWEIVNIDEYGWSCDPNHLISLRYLGHPRSHRIKPPPDEADVFIEACSFPADPDVNASYLWDHLGDVLVGYERKRSALKKRQLGEATRAKLTGKLEEHFVRVSSELTRLAEMLTPTPDLRLGEILFPGSSAEVEVCTQYVSDGNSTSFICATETQTFSLHFVAS